MIFLILSIINYTIAPVFSFYPGDPGIINVPGHSDDLVYWNSKAQPAFSEAVPKLGDKLSGQPFVNMFSFSVDLFVREITATNSHSRLILYKASAPVQQSSTIVDLDSFVTYMSTQSSMIMYLTTTNDLVITFFSGPSAIQYNIPPIQNIPLYTPFRVSVVAQDNLFTVYLNGKQTFQRITHPSIALPSGVTGNQFFYSSPDWANTPTQSVFVQNFHLWTRAISYKEVISAQPALALEADFIMTAETTASSCSK